METENRDDGQDIRILYRDKDIVCAVKPVGVCSESDGKNGMPELLSHALGGEVFPVHRLDKGVGGTMIYALNKKSAAYLSGLVSSGRFEKEYFAVVTGQCPESGEMKDLLFKDSKSNKSYVVKKMRRGVREASLSFERLSVKDGLSLVKIKLHTGRSHQIRVQFSSRKLPLAGDRRYGGAGEYRNIALWSYKTKFEGADGKVYDFSSAPPEAEAPWSCFSEFFTEV